MIRDRLQEMKELMKRGSSDENENSSKAEKSMALVEFCESVRVIKQEVSDLKFKVKNLKLLLNDSEQWKNDNRRREIEREIEEEKLVIGTMAKNIRNQLKSMKCAPNLASDQSQVIQRIKDVQLNSILNQLNEILRDYLNCLIKQREKSFRMLTDMMEVKGEKIYDIDELLEEGKIAIFTNNLLLNDIEEKFKLREAEDRRDKVLKIESSILEVRNLFNELALIVDLQQEKVEDIDKMVDDNLVRVESGKKKIFSASQKREKTRHRKLVIAFVCSGIILVVIVLVTLF